jgi:hypothetical protein
VDQLVLFYCLNAGQITIFKPGAQIFSDLVGQPLDGACITVCGKVHMLILAEIHRLLD